MKKIVILQVFIYFLYFVGFGQSTIPTLTVREVMDFEVGDVFEYQMTASNSGCYSTRVLRKEVLNKAYNTDSSEWTYTFDFVSYQKICGAMDWCGEHYQTTVTYTSLDSACHIALFANSKAYIGGIMKDSLSLFNPTYIQMQDSDYNNRVTLNIAALNFENIKYGQGLGLIAFSRNGSTSSDGGTLTYYKKGNEVVGTSYASLFSGPIPISPSPILTRREALDFEIGDVYQFERAGWGPNLFYLVEHTIIGKQLYTDSVTYQIVQKDTALDGGIAIAPSQITVTYKNLDDWVISPNDWCYTTVAVDSCSGTLISNHFEKVTAFGGNFYGYHLDAYRGMGIYQPSLPSYGNHLTNYNLTYFYKINENLNCGSYVSFGGPTSIAPFQEIGANSLTIQYDKNQQLLLIPLQNMTNTIDLEMVDMTGRIVWKQAVEVGTKSVTIATASFSKGIYVVRKTTHSHSDFVKVMIDF